MTGFIQRMLTRGTGRPTQAHQVTFHPRPRSRFEPTGDTRHAVDLSEMESSFQESRPVFDNTTRGATTSVTYPTPSIKPTEDKQPKFPEPKTRREEAASAPAEGSPRKTSSESKQATTASRRPRPDTNQGTVENSLPDHNKANAQHSPRTENIHPVRKADTKTEFRDILPAEQETPAEAKAEVIPAPTNRVSQDEPEGANPYENPFAENETPESAEPFSRNGEERNENATVRPNMELETPFAKTTDTRSIFKTDTPAQEVTISIGRIQVEFVQPEPRTVARTRPAVQRTSGFDDYAQARRGVRRR